MPEVIYTSDHPVPPLPESSLFTYLLPDNDQFDASLPAFIDGFTGRTLSRGDLKDSALRIATGIRGLGLKQHDVGMLWATNSIEWAQAAYGMMAAGVCVSPANYA